jgi:hypothetical protein
MKRWNWWHRCESLTCQPGVDNGKGIAKASTLTVKRLIKQNPFALALALKATLLLRGRGSVVLPELI